MSFSFDVAGNRFPNVNTYYDPLLTHSLVACHVFRRSGLRYPSATMSINVSHSTAYSVFTTVLPAVLSECPSGVDLILGNDFVESFARTGSAHDISSIPAINFSAAQLPVPLSNNLGHGLGTFTSL